MTTATTTKANDNAFCIAAVSDLEGVSPALLRRCNGLVNKYDLRDATDKEWFDAEQHFRKMVADTIARTRPESSVAVVVRKKAKRGKQVRCKIFGYPATAILRWMGQDGWTFEEAAVALATFGGHKVADQTIRIQLRAGVTGSRGEPADLTASQARTLREARN